MHQQHTQRIDLADAIQNLRLEMAKAMEEGEGQKVRFNVDQVELELAIQIEKEADAEGKISFKVFGSGLELGANGRLSEVTTNKIKIMLKPTINGGTIQVVDEANQKPR